MANLHETNARRFTDVLKKRLGSNLRAVVLYGSVARGESHRDSDVDLLVVTAPEPAMKVIDEVAYDIDFDDQFSTFLTPIEFSPEQLEHCLSIGDPFLERVLEEGKALYDDGTLKDIRDRVAAPRA